MTKVSQELSQDLHNHKVGSQSSGKINGPDMNRMEPLPDEDHDGKADYGVSRELSEDLNNQSGV